VTPSGTNNWHGQGFWYYRSNAWAANDWFNAASAALRPRYCRTKVAAALAADQEGQVVCLRLLRALRLRQSSTRTQNAGVAATISERQRAPGALHLQTNLCARSCTPPPAVTVNLLTLENQNRAPGAAPVFTIDPFVANLLSRLPAAAKATGGAGDGVNTLVFDYVQQQQPHAGQLWSPRGLQPGCAQLHNRHLVVEPGHRSTGRNIDTSFDTTPKVQNNDSIKFLVHGVALESDRQFH